MSGIAPSTVAALALFAILPSHAATCQQPTAATLTEPVRLPYTELRTLHSKIVGADYRIYVMLPATYGRSGGSYPVIYSTDANRSFSMIAGMLRTMTTPPPPAAPEVVVIGIGYPEEPAGDLLQWGVGRTRDLTPTNRPDEDRSWSRRVSALAGREVPVRTGGAPAFLRFLREELIPWAEANYRVSRTDRALAGYSYGGLFTLYALLESPGTFQRYFAGSPSITYDDGVLFRLEERSAAGRTDLPARLFMTAGGLEGEALRANVNRLADRLRARNYPSLQVETHVFEGESHVSCMPAAISRALRVLYAPAARPGVS